MRTKIISILILNLFFFAFFSCNGSKVGAETFVIKGKLLNGNGQIIVLEEFNAKGVTPIDSVELDKKGDFVFKYQPEDIGFYVLRTTRSNAITLLLAKNEEIYIEGDVEDLANSYSVKGSEGSELLYKYNKHTRNNIKQLDSLQKIYMQAQGKPDFMQIKQTLDQKYKYIYRDQKNFAQEFINKHCGSLMSLIVLNGRFGRSPLFDAKSGFEYFEKIDSALLVNYPSNKHTLSHHTRCIQIKLSKEKEKIAEKILSIGKVAPDVTLNDTGGNPVALSSLRGKFVLLDFWASWCGPCRKENPTLVRLYEKYHDKGFEIYGVSLDRSKDKWVQAINKDNISWIQVSDLKYWNSPAARLYNISSIPNSYLLDKEGRIIAKGLRGNALEKKLAELFD